MTRSRFFHLALALALATATACSSNTQPPTQRLHGAGVTFVVPLQTSDAKHGPAGIDYRGKTLAASTDGRTLTVNGRDYGSLASGDVVVISVAGDVQVNGVPRAAR